MKTCAYCKKEDLHDRAKKCPHCGMWLGVFGAMRWVAEIIGWVFLVIFVGSLGSCAVFLAFQ